MRLHLLKIICLALNLVAWPLLVRAETPVDWHLFVGKNQSFGTQLWQTDNTAAGTKVFSYLTKTPNADSNYYSLGKVDSYGIFAAFTPETGQELWRTDGTTAGTVLIKDLVPGVGSGLPLRREPYTNTTINLKDRLLFWGQTADQLLLYSTDGRSENTLVLAQFPRSNERSINVYLPNFYSLNQQVFFWVNDGVHQLELWKTDGTTAGTQLSLDASEEPADFNNLMAYAEPLIPNSNSLFFISADQRSNEPQNRLDYSLWRVDGQTSERLTQFKNQIALSFNLVAANQERIIWVKTNEDTQQAELWQWEFNTKRASLIQQLPAAEAGQRSLLITPAVFFKNKLYLWFVVLGEQTFYELWVSDFTATGTERLVSLPNPNQEYQEAPILFSFAEHLYFMLSDGIRPSALWITDGTVTGTKNLLTIKDGLYAGGAGDSWPARPTPYILRADKLIFPTFSPKDRNLSQLWSLTPGQPETPLLLGEFDDPQLLPPAQNDQGQFVYFLSGKQRWQTDGTIEGTKALGQDPIRQTWQPTEWPSGGLTEILALPTKKPSWLLAEVDAQAGKEPWLVSTEIAQSKVLKDINTTATSAELRQVEQLGSTTYFVLNSRLWVTESDPSTAHELTELPKEESVSFNAKALVRYQNTLYFLTENAQKTNSLWQVTAGVLKRLKTFPKASYVWLFPSSQGVYAVFYPPETAGSWSVELWQAQEQQLSTVLQGTEDKQNRLATLLETEQGLLYVVEPNYALNTRAKGYQLIMRPKQEAESVLMDGFEPVANVLSDTLVATTKHNYMVTQKTNDPLNYQLMRIDWTQKKLVAIDPPALPQQSRVLAAPEGLFILSQEPAAKLWWLADDAEQASLVKTFEHKQLFYGVQVVGKHLYLNKMQVTQDDTSFDLWVSDTTTAGTLPLKTDLEMLAY